MFGLFSSRSVNGYLKKLGGFSLFFKLMFNNDLNSINGVNSEIFRNCKPCQKPQNIFFYFLQVSSKLKQEKERKL